MYELREQRGVFRNILEPDDDGGDPIEVAPDADMVHSRDLAHVVDLIGDLR